MSTPITSVTSGIPTSLTSQPSAGAGTTPAGVSSDQFLKLLVAQLQNQNPLSPQDGSQFVAQLAQITSVQQGAETNQHLTDLANIQSSSARTQLTGLVGHTVTARTSSVTVGAQGLPPPVQIHLDGAASSVKADITDSTGKKIKSIDLGPRSQGDFALDWVAAGVAALPPGTYSIALTATSSTNQSVNAYSMLKGVVGGVQFQNGNTLLQVGTATIAPADITNIQ
jgi:flagellar basal-body rod modification protein FlgD